MKNKLLSGVAAVAAFAPVAAFAETPTSLTELLAAVDISSAETFAYATLVVLIGITMALFGYKIVRRMVGR